MREVHVQIVDEQDRPIGGASKQEALQRGLIRRIVRGITEDELGRILLHKRAPHKQSHPNVWDWLPSGHVDLGESYEQAIMREAEEELGIPASMFTCTELETYYSSRTIGDIVNSSFSCVYKISLPSTAPIRLDTSEATELHWFTVPELAALIKKSPDQFAPGVIRLFPAYYHA